MNLSRSFSYMFDDPDWFTKLALGALIAVIPVLNFAWLGYGAEIVRRVHRGDSQPLPAWDNLGKYFVDGLILTIATFIYTLPLMIIFCLAFFTVMLPAFTSSNSDLSGTIAPFSTLGFFAILCVAIFYGFAYSFIYPAIVIHFSEKGTFGSVFQLVSIFKVIRSDTNTYLIAWLVGIGAGLLAGMIAGAVGGVVGWIPFVGWIASMLVGGVTGAWAFMVMYYAYGLVERSPQTL